MLHLYHLHLSKKQKKEEVLLIDSIAYLAGIIGPFLTIPQLYNIWVENNSSGVSAVSWASYSFFNLIIIVYGIQHKNKLIVINNFLWFVMQMLVVIGVLFYS